MARDLLLSPGMGGLDSERLLLLGATSVSALALGFWGDGDFKNWGGGRGSDFVLLRVFESCEDILVRCVVEPARLRVRVTGWNDEAVAISGLVWGGGIETGGGL